MQTFPILKLPYVALIHVLKVMKRDDLLVFSFISKSSKNLSIDARRKMKMFKWKLCRQSSNGQHSLEYLSSHGMKVPMSKTVEMARESENLKFLNINNQLVPMYETFELYEPVWNIGDPEQPIEQNYKLMVQLSAHILEVFKCQDFYLSLYKTDLPQDLFVLKHTRRFKKLGFSGNDPIPADHLKFVLEELKIERFTIHGPRVFNFEWDGPLRMDELSVYHSDWLTFEAILNSECKVLDLGHNGFTDVQLNIFIKRWLDGGLQNLEFCWFHCHVESAEDILQEIQTIPFHLGRHPNRHPRDRVHRFQEPCVDVRRSDGVLATISISPQKATFVMAIWNK